MSKAIPYKDQLARLFREFEDRAKDLKPILKTHKVAVISVAVLMLIYGISKLGGSEKTVIVENRKVDFDDSVTLSNPSKEIFEGKERNLSRATRELVSTQEELKKSLEHIAERLGKLEEPKPVATEAIKAATPSGAADQAVPEGQPQTVELGGRVHAAPSFGADSGPVDLGLSSSRRSRRAGPSIISFPVKSEVISEALGVVLPSGSYVKAKLMTGVEAPEGKTYPALLQLDFAFIGPNEKKIDLAGCFVIAKAEGDLSTERVQMQATKLSCVSKRGKMFEREINGFIADDKDNSFAVMGSVNSKQDRVAAMAFLSSVVEGISKSIQAAQTTQSTNPLGGSSSIVTGDQMKFAAAGGAGNAASMVTQWYLKQAQNLLPTINVGSGQDVWLVMKDKVDLPNEFFRKNEPNGGKNGTIFDYLSRASD